MTQTFTGKVFLVGAGPGDPDLLTVKAHRLLRQADVILHDDLVPRAILSLAGHHAEIVSVGKRCGAKGITQDEINARMIAAAHRGLDVVRLKNGDPAVFGRLSEELDALEAAGVPFEVVPGVTAGIAAAASLHVSLTDRRTSSRIVIVTGHHAQDSHNSRKKIDWSALAREDATLVVYMPGHDFTGLRDELLAAGLPPDIPAVIVSRASTPAQREWLSTLAQIDAAPRMDSPSILLIGHSLARVRRKSAAENSALASAIAFAAAELPLRG